MESKFARSLAGAGAAPEASSALQGSIEPSELTLDVEIGRGAFSRVYRGTYKGQVVAIKKMTVPRRELDRHLQGELTLLSSSAMVHSNLIKYHGVCIEPGAAGSQTIMVVTEFMNGGDLRSILKRTDHPLSWSLRVRIARDIAAAVTHLHENNVVHRDIKTENVLLDESWRCVLADYGFARKMAAPAGTGASAAMTICGTDEFMAPG